MRNTLKTLGILCIIAAALFIAACGELPEADLVVTFDANGGKINGQDRDKVTVTKDNTVNNPGEPTKPTTATEPTAVGFYKLATTTGTVTFRGWKVGSADGSDYVFTKPVTSNITLVAAWNISGGGEATNLTSSLTASDGNILEQVVAYLVKDNTPNGTNDKYLLVLGENIIASKQIYLRRGNLKIKSSSAAQREIKGFTPSGTANAANVTNGSNHVAFLIGDSNTPTGSTIAPTLTLNSIVLKGIGTDVGDSLVRVRKSATLIMENGSKVTGHKNSATNGDGLNGNGSAVCISGATLTMKEGSVIEENESTKDSGVGTAPNTNKNRVGGVYTIIDGTLKPNLNIEGGQIIDNECTAGNTKDVYATEGGNFFLSGNVKINEITINGDAPGSSPPMTTAANAGGNSVVRAVITVSNLGTQANVKLSLRSTSSSIDVVKTVWTNNAVLIAPAGGGTLSAADVRKFTLSQFKCYGGTPTSQDIGDGYKISDSGADIGKLVVVTP